jgi:hypothetical protein
MWYCFQGLIIFAVIASNIHWNWVHNTYAAAFIGYLSALAATEFLARLLDRRAMRAALREAKPEGQTAADWQRKF